MVSDELLIEIDFLMRNSLYWTIRNWFGVRKVAKKLNIKKYSGIFRERPVEYNKK